MKTQSEAVNKGGSEGGSVKTTLRDFVSVLLAAGGIALLVAGNVRGADDDAMPPAVKALIGMRISAKAPKKGGNFPDWKALGGGVLEVKTKTGEELGYELLYQRDLSIFVIEALDAEGNRTVLDARVLPRRLLTYYIKEGKAIEKKNWPLFYAFQVRCMKNEEFNKEAVIAGLVRPEPGKEHCQHWSRQVKRAWSIDPSSGHISPAPAKGISCFYGAEESCQ